VTAAMSTTLALSGDDLLPHVLPHNLHSEPLFHIGDHAVYFNNHMLMMTISTVVAMWVMWVVAKRIGASGPAHEAETYVTKGRVSQIIEVILIYLREEMARPALGKLTDKYIGYIWTTFFFILFCNLLGMVPWGYGIQSVMWLAQSDPHSHAFQFWGHLQGTATGNLAVTGALALVSMFMRPRVISSSSRMSGSSSTMSACRSAMASSFSR